ncbi:hypothetical protein [uncultured Methylobacterium sp.]|uniref:hypothetical protein n=1 Tax=uncultured Methylobacterium sp. TaxID=157278 RepID=UPI0035CB2F8E
MIVALFALSAAMVVGGIAAVIQGFPFVRLESGLAMVIAGASVAAGGTVVAGLGVVAAGLRRVERALAAGRIADAGGPAADGVPASARPSNPSSTPLAMPASVSPAPRAADRAPSAWPHPDPAPGALALPVRPTLPGLLAPGPEAALLGGQSRTGPAFAEPAAGEPEAEEPAASAPPAGTVPEPREPELPLPGLTPPGPVPEPEPRAPEPVAGLAPEDDLFAAPAAPAPSGASVFSGPPTLRPSLDAAPAPETQAEPAAREVVGRYASGGNTYVMFADGAIEAETPQGRFTFVSLDELKAFVEAGGESGARGAA